MDNIFDLDDKNIDLAWCPGCGNFGINKVLKSVLKELKIKPENLVIISGIGQAAKMPQYLKTNMFNGLHGRALPVATAVKACNPGLTVIAEGGDGDMYGEGGNHFIHAIRRNPDLTNIVHNNMVYGLTKGQASPTSQPGFKTSVQVDGVFLEPFNPLAVAIALNASFVARAFIGDEKETAGLIKEAIMHKGFALVDIFQPCVTFNKQNTYTWFKENTFYLKNHDYKNRLTAFEMAVKNDKFPLGIFYKHPGKKTFEENLELYKADKTPVIKRIFERNKMEKLIKIKR
ncbi:MAG: 2-oxoacid ferredoxin oxidoreductase [Candidatus Atribacteria bacterium]|nr:2-oxoacid ferredoxin oxidoreductase [Candidatus Atribacteria bacterium]